MRRDAGVDFADALPCGEGRQRCRNIPAPAEIAAYQPLVANHALLPFSFRRNVFLIDTSEVRIRANSLKTKGGVTF
jgi:hypothetical protein